MILGIDEVGRGAWAGPLVVGAVCLNGVEIAGLTDSKALTKKQREELYGVITASGASMGLGWVSASEVDEIGLGEALRLATRRAVEQITTPYHEIIIDGTVNFLADTGKGSYVTTLKKADLLVPSVSAASIVAKVARDRWMAEQDARFKGYGFAGHVGYGTAKHSAALRALGVCELHRRSFAPVQRALESAPEQKQARFRHTFLRRTSRLPAELVDTQTSSASRDIQRKKAGKTHDASLSGALSSRAIGDRAEEVVADFLRSEGYEVLARNWKTKFCEIDIVSRKEGTVYFVEVKHRKDAKRGGGIAAITSKKLKQMAFAAKIYAKAEGLENADLRLAVAATLGEPPKLEQFLALG